MYIIFNFLSDLQTEFVRHRFLSGKGKAAYIHGHTQTQTLPIARQKIIIDPTPHTMTDLQIPYEQQLMESSSGYPQLKDGEVSTGTTILALPFDKGVIVCADSRTSTGTYVANRVSDKLVQLSESIYCCRSGSSADTQALTDYVMYFLKQWRYVVVLRTFYVFFQMCVSSFVLSWMPCDPPPYRALFNSVTQASCGQAFIFNIAYVLHLWIL